MNKSTKYEAIDKKQEEKVGKCNLKGYYTLYNGTIFDDSAWRQLKRMVPKYRAFGEATHNVTFEPTELYTSWLKSNENENVTEDGE